MTTSQAQEKIPLKPISSLDSLSATVTLNVNGTTNGERAQGNLNGLLTMNGKNSKITVSGSLLGEIAAQVGGSLHRLVHAVHGESIQSAARRIHCRQWPFPRVCQAERAQGSGRPGGDESAESAGDVDQ